MTFERLALHKVEPQLLQARRSKRSVRTCASHSALLEKLLQRQTQNQSTFNLARERK